MKRTDLACDFLPPQETPTERVRSYAVTVDDALARELRREKGVYCTVECDAVVRREPQLYDTIAARLAKSVSMLLPQKSGRVLVVGLGNPAMTADSLGAQVCECLAQERCENVSVLTPNVLGVTGIESFDVVAGVTARTAPSAVIAVDSLASAAVGRLASAFQVSDTGITPGSGVSNHRTRLCRESLGVPVLSVGVPLVVYASTIIEDALGRECPECDETVASLLVTPKDVDLYVRDCARIVSRAITAALA